MDRDRLNEVENLFHEARLRNPSERGAFLDGACRDDLELRAEVESLLAHGNHHPPPGPVLDSNPVLERGPLQEGAGTRIGHYKLLQQLGEGGFGVVYMAEQREPVRRRVALKIIKLGMDTKQVIARFEAERQALALMDHPNIAKVLDAGATQTGRPFFVMELVRGVPITEYCDKAAMSTDARLRLFVLVCRAVQHAHQKGIVHRDIKPSNVLVTLHDGEPVPKVIDFGIAKATNQELTEKTVFTEFRQFVGTPEYMSPEQAELSGLDIDTRADVYSLGILLYELLTGTTPVDPLQLREAGYDEMQRILQEVNPPEPSSRVSTMGDEAAIVARKRGADQNHLARSLKGDLDWIVLKAIEKDRSRRYETAVAFALDVERHLSNEPVVASPPSRLYKWRKFVRRNRGAVAAGAAIAAVLLLGVAGTTAGFIQARRALAAEQQSRNAAEESANAAREEAARQRALVGFFERSLISTGPRHFGAAAPAKVVDLLDLAAARLQEGEMADQPATRAVLARALGMAYLDRDRWEDAVQHLRFAIEWLEDGRADPMTFSRAARELDRIDAEPYFEVDVGVDPGGLREQALATLAPLVAAREPAVAEELMEWSQVLFLRNRPAEAADLLRPILEIVRSGAGRSPDLALVEFNLACAEVRLGNDDEARRLYASSGRGLCEIVARGDADAADDWMERCQHPAIGLALDTEQGNPLHELIELALSRHEVRNLAMAEAFWNAATILEDIDGGEQSYQLMREVVEIAREFGENRLMLGTALVRLARMEWRRGQTVEVIELCREARSLLGPTQGKPYRRATGLIVGCLVERIVADPGSTEAPELARRVAMLAGEATAGLDRAPGVGSLVPWWMLCGDVARMHRALAEAGAGEHHEELARTWTQRLRTSLEPYLERPFPRGVDFVCTDLAKAALLLQDATQDELETARELAELADQTAGSRLTLPVDTLAQALFRLDDVEGAVREARRAQELLAVSGPVRGMEERLAHYEAVLSERD